MYVPHIGTLYPVLVNTDASCDSNNLVYSQHIVKKLLYEEASTMKPEWLLIAGFLTIPLIRGGFSFI
jgi:hypothetical protein